MVRTAREIILMCDNLYYSNARNATKREMQALLTGNNLEILVIIIDWWSNYLTKIIDENIIKVHEEGNQ